MSKPAMQDSGEKTPPFSGACSKCHHRKTCKIPCAFVDRYLKHENRGFFEMDFGPKARVVFPFRNEVRESALIDHETGKMSDSDSMIFSDENHSPFAGAINTERKQTGIFVNRFFYGKSIQDLAEKYKVSKADVSIIYGKAKKRIGDVVGAMDRQKVAISSREKIANMPATVQYFLLHVLFHLNSIEIAKIFDVNDSNVRRGVRQVRDKVIAGEFDILEYTDKEKLIAQEKLERDRSKKT